MSKKKLFASLLLLAALLMVQAGTALAAPAAAPAAQDTTPITGTVQSITVETDSTTGASTVVVVITDETGAEQTLRLSVATAAGLGLVTVDPSTGVATVNEAALQQPVTIQPGDVIVDDTGDDTTAQHPVGSALSDFFSELLGVDYDTIMQYHDEGTGFGVIAQALWMTKKLEGDSAVFAAILDAKKSGDYSAVTLPDGTTASNWGQFKKALLQGDKQSNLGAIMSGRAEQDGTTDDSQSPGNGRGNGNGNGHGNGNGNGNGNGHGNGNGNGNGD